MKYLLSVFLLTFGTAVFADTTSEMEREAVEMERIEFEIPEDVQAGYFWANSRPEVEVAGYFWANNRPEVEVAGYFWAN